MRYGFECESCVCNRFLCLSQTYIVDLRGFDLSLHQFQLIMNVCGFFLALLFAIFYTIARLFSEECQLLYKKAFSRIFGREPVQKARAESVMEEMFLKRYKLVQFFCELSRGAYAWGVASALLFRSFLMFSEYARAVLELDMMHKKFCVEMLKSVNHFAVFNEKTSLDLYREVAEKCTLIHAVRAYIFSLPLGNTAANIGMLALEGYGVYKTYLLIGRVIPFLPFPFGGQIQIQEPGAATLLTATTLPGKS